MDQVGANDVMERMDRGVEMVKNGQFESGMKELFWCWDNGEQRDPSYSAVRVSFLVSYIRDLARQYPPAMTEAKRRLDSVEDGLLRLQRDQTALKLIVDTGG